jgi:hypothetical protein
MRFAPISVRPPGILCNVGATWFQQRSSTWRLPAPALVPLGRLISSQKVATEDVGRSQRKLWPDARQPATGTALAGAPFCFDFPQQLTGFTIAMCCPLLQTKTSNVARGSNHGLSKHERMVERRGQSERIERAREERDKRQREKETQTQTHTQTQTMGSESGQTL